MFLGNRDQAQPHSGVLMPANPHKQLCICRCAKQELEVGCDQGGLTCSGMGGFGASRPLWPSYSVLGSPHVRLDNTLRALEQGNSIRATN
jgi:hypothetical protein